MASAGVCAILALSAPAANGADRESFIPDDGHVGAFEQGQDCSVYRAVARKAKLQRQDLIRRIDEEKEILKSRYDVLQTCAQNKGKSQNGPQMDSSVMAELCPSDYQSWIAPLYRLRMLREDVEQSKQDLDSVGELIGDYCKKLPEQTINGEF
jgi:hypothetical protein